MGAPDLPCPHPLPTGRRALRPIARLPPVAPLPLRTHPGGGRLRGELALMVLPGAAGDLPRRHRLPALRGAPGPGVGDPPGLVGGEVALDGEGRGQGGELVGLGAAQGLLADQAALGPGADLGVPAVPGTPRRVAHIQARHRIRARQPAHRLGTFSAALRGGAVRPLLPLTSVLRAEHRAMRRLAVDLAVGVVRPGAPGLAAGLLALRGTILVADRLGAVPGAMGVAGLLGAGDHVSEVVVGGLRAHPGLLRLLVLSKRHGRRRPAVGWQLVGHCVGHRVEILGVPSANNGDPEPGPGLLVDARSQHVPGGQAGGDGEDPHGWVPIFF
mmetsp:Transcript_57607/g.123843  ORF Transcript_57607/g.123843 Transcript_57607/m.123843 type:complete len:328 (+) Transcript_57607:771-1754(+)